MGVNSGAPVLLVSGTRRVNLVTYPVTSHEGGKDREVFTTNGITWYIAAT